MKSIDQTYQFDSRLSNCDACPLQAAKDEGECLSYRPISFNGIMIIGEFPQAAEQRVGFPIAGKRQTVLQECLSWAGIDLAHCYVSNAVLCSPSSSDPARAKTALGAALHCRSRLLTEISHLKPRIIIPLGQAPLDMITGVRTEVTKRVPSDCGTCGNKRSWFAWTCSRTKCDAPDILWNTANKPGEIHECSDGKTGKWVRRKRICSDCGGKLTQVVSDEAFVSDHSISSIAGSVSRLSQYDAGRYVENPEEILVIPSWSPSHLMRPVKSTNDKKVGGQFLVGAACHHFAKAKRLLDSDPRHTFTWSVAESPDAISEFLAEENHPDSLYAVDIETNNKDPYQVTDVTCVGIGSLSRRKVIVVDTSGKSASDPLVQRCIEFLESKVRKIYQNGNYDITVLSRLWNVDHREYAGDTMVLHHAVAPDEPHNLSHLAFTYTDVAPWKPPKKKGGMEYFSTKEMLHEYNARDVAITGFVYERLTEEAEKELALEVAALDMRKMHLAYHMQQFGLPINVHAMEQVGKKAEARQEAAFSRLQHLAGPIPQDIDKKPEAQAFNPNSVRHLQYVLYDPRGPYKLSPKDFTQSGLPSTSKSTLIKYQDNAFAQSLLDYRDAQKTLATYVQKLPVDDDGRVRCQWKPTGTRTGRWSSSPNLQNWPKWLRSSVQPTEGRVFVGADYAQLELRILAALSGDAEMIRRCRDADESRKLEPDWDPHSYVASLAFPQYTKLNIDDPRHDSKNPHCPCQKCKRKQLRDLNKRVVYGLNYGAGAYTILESIRQGGYDDPNLDEALVRRVISSYFQAFPKVQEYRDKVITEAHETGYVREPIVGRRRIFPRKEVDATVASNFAIQAAAASIMDVSAWNLFTQLHTVDPSAGIFAQVHDAIYVECDQAAAEAMVDLVERSLCCSVQLVDGSEWMPLLATAEIGTTWKDV